MTQQKFQCGVDCLTELISDEDQQYLRQASQVFIGYSAGLDSTLLLHSLSALDLKQPPIALHCDHGIQSGSQSWAEHCRQTASQLDMQIEVISLNLGSDASEDEARRARMQAFERYLYTGSVCLLYTSPSPRDA